MDGIKIILARCPMCGVVLSTSEMMNYIAQVQQFAAEFLNTVIPDPGEQAEINF